jgi:hypothetical protein
MKTIAFSQKHIFNNQNANLRYEFPNEIEFQDQEIGLASISIFYSFYNISQDRNNNTFQYEWFNNSTQQMDTFDVVYPDLIAEVSTLNNYFQYVMKSNGHYLNDANGNIAYFAEMVVDSSRFAISIITKQVPTAFSTLYPQTDNTHITLPAQSFNPVVKMVASSGFNKLIGYSNTFATSNVAQTTRTHFSSQAPILNPDSNLVVSIGGGLVDNPYATETGIIYSFPVFASAGEQILSKPNEIAFLNVRNMRTNFIDLQIRNADTGEIIKLLDPEISIMLLVRDKK